MNFVQIFQDFFDTILPYCDDDNLNLAVGMIRMLFLFWFMYGIILRPLMAVSRFVWNVTKGVE